MPSQAFPSEDRPYSCADVLGVTGVSRNALFNYLERLERQRDVA